MEKIFNAVGLEGKYQNILFAINLLTAILPTIYTLQIPYLTKYPSFLVRKLNSEDSTKLYEMEYSIELCDSNIYQIIKNPKKSLINWSYSFDLYCDKDAYNTIITSLVFVGGMIGTLLIVPLPDKCGRAKVLKYISIISLIFHLNLLFNIGPIHLIIINFLGGLFCQIFLIGYALFTEFFPKDKNGLYIGIYNAIYPFEGIFLCFFFMFSNSWRLLYFITSLLHIYYTYITLKYMVESPRWLHSTGDKEKCLGALTEIAFYNNRTEEWNKFQNDNQDIINKLGTAYLEIEGSNNNIEVIKEDKKINRTYNIIDILKLDSQRNTFIKLTLINIGCSYNYYGIILNLGKMKGNFYLNSIFAFLGEFLCEGLSGFYSDKFGRIKLFIISCIIGTIGYILYMVSPIFKFLFVFIAMVGYSGIFNTITIYTPEIYPTKIRNVAYSFSSFLSRLGPICVPILSQAMPELIDYSFIFSGIIIGIIGFSLEETLGKKRMDIIPEEEIKYELNSILINE